MTEEEEEVIFYYQLGVTFTQWVHVERGLLIVAQACLPQSELTSLMYGFYAIENFRSKLAFVDAIVCSKIWVGPILDRWKLLNECCTTNAKRRNEIAHGSVVGFPMSARPGRRFAIVNWIDFLNTTKPNGGPPTGSSCVRDIVLIGAQFHDLANRLENLSRAIGKKPEPFPEYGAQELRPPTIRELRNQICEALAPQLAASRRSRRAPGDEAAEQERADP